MLCHCLLCFSSYLLTSFGGWKWIAVIILISLINIRCHGGVLVINLCVCQRRRCLYGASFYVFGGFETLRCTRGLCCFCGVAQILLIYHVPAEQVDN